MSIPVHDILRIAADELNHSVEQITSKEDKASVNLARHLSMWLIRKCTKKSFPEIKKHYDLKHHQSVIMGVRRIETMRANDTEFNRLTLRLLAVCQGDQIDEDINPKHQRRIVFAARMFIESTEKLGKTKDPLGLALGREDQSFTYKELLAAVDGAES